MQQVYSERTGWVEVTRRNYRIEFASSAKPLHPLLKLLVSLLTLAAIPFILVMFTGLLAFLLVVLVSLAAAAAVFFKFMAPSGRNRGVVDNVQVEGSAVRADSESNSAKPASIQGAVRRKPVVIDQPPQDS